MSALSRDAAISAVGALARWGARMCALPASVQRIACDAGICGGAGGVSVGECRGIGVDERELRGRGIQRCYAGERAHPQLRCSIPAVWWRYGQQQKGRVKKEKVKGES